jgi:hypothetical protein
VRERRQKADITPQIKADKMTRSNEGGAAGAAEGIAAPASDSSASKEAEAQAAGAADFSPPPPLQELIGRCVRLDGLQSKPELNGLTGSCVGLDLATGRVTVTIGAAKSFNVKPENVRPLCPWQRMIHQCLVSNRVSHLLASWLSAACCGHR